MKNELVTSILLLERMEEIANSAEADYEAHPEDEGCEARFDLAYKNEFKYFVKCAELVQEISGGKIDFMTAKRMISTEREKLLKIL